MSAVRSAPPTYADFVSAIYKLYDRLTELRHIDAMLDYLESRNQTADVITPGFLEIEVHLGQTAPFVKKVHQNGNSVDDLETKRDAIWADAQAWGHESGESLITAMDPWISSYTHGYQLAFDELGRAGDRLGFIPDDFTRLSGTDDAWQGEAAENFRTNFCNAAEQIRDNQLYVANAMQCGLRVAEGINNMALHSLMNALEAATKCVVSQLEARAADNRGPSMADFLEFASVAFGVASIVSFPAAPVSAGLALASISLGYAATQIPQENAQNTTITASSAREVDSALHKTVTTVGESSGKLFDGLDKEFREVARAVTKCEASNSWFVRTPWLIDGVPGSDFYHESSSRND